MATIFLLDRGDKGTTTTQSPIPTTTTKTTTTTTTTKPPPTFTVMISINNGESFCGGSLIKRDRVLTAHQCCLEANTFTIFLGGIYEPSRQIGKPSTTFKTHDSNRIDDGVCVIHLDAPLSGEGFRTIRLPASSQCSETFEKDKATISSWGRPSNDETSNTKPIYTDVIINEKEVCKHHYPEADTVGTICTYDTSRSGICDGHAGDPLFITEPDGLETQIGIASFGPHTDVDSRCSPDYPDGFVRVTSFLQLICDLGDVIIRH
ncbi:Hypothetical predicted protein [Cloeon dipterum]|nr:Hypothetical predicted protein [Cloeon dipterum]